MFLRGWERVREKAFIGLLAVVVLAVAVPVTPASAQGFLEFLFGGLGRRQAPPRPPVQVNSPSEFFDSLFDGGRRRDRESVRGSGTVHSGFCVRLCDGRYFPVQSQRNASAAEQCSNSCPASQTKVFGGGNIEHARAGDGQRYSDLPNAFVYRERLIPGCTCNGKSSVGLVTRPATEDSTLRAGDIVATNSGLTVYNGRDPGRQANFTPVDTSRISNGLRSQLADVKVMPRPPSLDVVPETPAQDHTASTAGNRRRLSAR